MTVAYCRRPKESIVLLQVVRHVMTNSFQTVLYMPFHVTSVTLTILCVYLIRRSSSVTRAYASLLNLLLLGCVVEDVFVQWIFDPVIVNPRLCVYRNAPPLNIPFSAALGYAGLHSLVAAGGPVYFALFIYRHQALILPGSKLKFSSTMRNSFLIVILILYLSLGVTVYIGRIPTSNTEEYEEHMSNEWDPAILERIDCFSMAAMYPYWVAATILPSFAVIFLIAIARHTFSMLRQVRHISIKMRASHRELTRSLVIQVLLPVVIVIIPFGAVLTLTSVLFNISPTIYDGININLGDFALFFLSFHSTAHCVALIATTPAFRNAFFELIGGTHKVPAVTVSNPS